MTAETLLRFTRRAMACEFEIILQGDDRRRLADVAQAAFEEIERLEEQLSIFRPHSEVSYVNAEAAHRPVTVEPGLFRLLALARDVWVDTGGAFDITIGPVSDLWREAERTGTEPSGRVIGAAAGIVGMDHVSLDDTLNTVSFDTVGVKIDLGAIGKGCAVGRAIRTLQDCGVDAALVSAGRGSIYALGAPRGTDGWSIGIRHPSIFDSRIETVTLKDRALSTSGGVRQRDQRADERFGHIIDPQAPSRARSMSPVVSVTVTAAEPALADALATAMCVRGRPLAEKYCRSHPEVGVLFVEKEKDQADFTASWVTSGSVFTGG